MTTRWNSPWTLLAIGLCSCTGGGPPYFVQGTAVLPMCNEPPDYDLAGTTWFDHGQVTLTSEGCLDAAAGEVFEVCSLNWDVVSVEGSDLEFLVDNEYTVQGRLCGDQLHLQGGWWLPVVDGAAGCTYEEDSADEVGIQAEASTLTVASEREMAGVLSVRGSCSADYEVSFTR